MLNIEYDSNIERLYDIFSRIIFDIISAGTSRGFKTIAALSGGHTPYNFYRRMAELTHFNSSKNIDWNSVSFFMGDERHVPLSSNESNYKNAVKSLCTNSKITGAAIKPLDFNLETPRAVAADYESKIMRATNGTGTFNLSILGMGEDGHTASLFERIYYDAAPETKRTAIKPGAAFISHYVNKLSQIRYSLTMNSIISSHNIIMLVIGAQKKNILKTVMNENCKANLSPAAAVFNAAKFHKNITLTLITDIL